jgi:peptidyl-dipeptidase A
MKVNSPFGDPGVKWNGMGKTQPQSIQATASVLKSDTVTLRFGRRLNDVEKQAQALVKLHGDKLSELYEKANYATWDMYVLGGEEVSKRKPDEDEKVFDARLESLQEHYAKATDAADDAYWSYTKKPEVLRDLEAIRAQKDKIQSHKLRRQIDLLYNIYLEGNVAPALLKDLNERKNDLSITYGGYKRVYKGQVIDDGKVEHLLNETRDPKEAQELAELKYALADFKLKPDGPTYAEKIIDAVKKRNEFAHVAGYKNYYSMMLALQEIDEDQLVRLLKEVKAMTDAPYAKLRDKMDEAVMKRFNVSKAEARLPWYQGGVNEHGVLDDVLNFKPDEPFIGVDPRPILKKAAKLMGADDDAMVDKSDLFPRPGKTSHWFMFNLRTPDDIRTIGNIDPNFAERMAYTVNTELHETEGHGVGYSFVKPTLPPTLRDLHTITTESDAMMMESLMYDKRFLKEACGFSDKVVNEYAAKGKQYREAHNLLGFRKNYMLITDFEREMYNLKPQDLTMDNVNQLWAKKSKEYLGLEIPPDRNKPDWTFKNHFASAPVYYECYFLAQLMRAQVHATIDKLSPKHGILSKTAGNYLRQHRGPGRTHHWANIVERMTGEPLGTKALKAEFDRLDLDALK